MERKRENKVQHWRRRRRDINAADDKHWKVEICNKNVNVNQQQQQLPQQRRQQQHCLQ